MVNAWAVPRGTEKKMVITPGFLIMQVLLLSLVPLRAVDGSP